MKDRRGNRQGNAYIEYFVLALVVLVATIAFYDQGRFKGAKGSVENNFNRMVQKVLAP